MAALFLNHCSWYLIRLVDGYFVSIDILLQDAIATGKYYARVSLKIKTSDDDAHRCFQRVHQNPKYYPLRQIVYLMVSVVCLDKWAKFFFLPKALMKRGGGIEELRKSLLSADSINKGTLLFQYSIVCSSYLQRILHRQYLKLSFTEIYIAFPPLIQSSII
jgi:hypothetical protein